MTQGKSALPTQLFNYLLLAILAVLVLYPLLTLLVASFFSGQPGALGTFTWDGYAELLRVGGLGKILTNSFLYAFSSTSLCLCFGLLFAWSIARTDIPGRRMLEMLLPLPFFIPDLLSAISWVMLANPQSGLINRLATALFDVPGHIVNIYGWAGLLFHGTLHNTAFIFLMLLGFFYNMDPSLEEAAATLGASQFETATRITIPILMPAILGTSLLSFIKALEAFIDPLVFGSPAGIYMFSNEIYRVLRHRQPPEYGTATALSMILLLITFALVVTQWKMLGTREFVTVSGKGYQPRRIRLPRFIKGSLFALAVLYVILAVIVPVGQLIMGTFFKIFGYYRWEDLTFYNWVTVFNDRAVRAGLKNTIIYSTCAATGVIVLGGLVGYIRVRTRHWLGRAMELIAWIPWTAPGLIMGLALLWAWLLLPPPFNLYGTSLLVIIGFIVKGLPLGTRIMQSAIMQVSTELEESARVFGASWLSTVGRILLPLLRMGIIAAFVVIFAQSARDLTIPLLLYAHGTATLTIALLRYYEEGYQSITAVVAVIQLMLVFGLLGLERLTRSRLVEH